MYTECVEFNRWLEASRPNDKYIYYVGSHMADSILSKELAKLTWEHAFRGRVYLVQEKVHSYTFKYIAVKASSPPLKALVPLTVPEIKKNPNLMRRYTARRHVKPEVIPVEINNG